MSEFFLYRYDDEERLLAALAEAAASRGWSLQLDTPPAQFDFRLRIGRSENVYLLDAQAQRDEGGWTIEKLLGEKLNCPWIALFLQEKTFWELMAFNGAERVDMFSTFPQSWDEGEEFERARRGNPELVAELWGVDWHSIAGYFRNWGDLKVFTENAAPNILAYPTDRCPYGDLWQVLDVMKALGAPELNKGGTRVHTLRPASEPN